MSKSQLTAIRADDEVFDPSFLKIDLDRLDVELIRQPDLFFTFSLKQAQARSKMDDARANLDLVRADLSTRIRNNPKKYSIEKVTEAAIAAAVATHPKFIAASDSFRESRYEYDVLDAGVKALDQKKRSLENLVSLHGQSYFAKPNITGSERKLMESETKKARKVLRVSGTKK